MTKIRFILAASMCMALALSPGLASQTELLNRAVTEHVLPGYGRAAANAERLAEVASRKCAQGDAELTEAFNDGWDSWVAISHLRFGPSEVDDRGFAMGFWPDTRGVVPKTLAQMIASEDPAVTDREAYAEVSIAGRGYTALEFLLFDPAFADSGDYGCALIAAVAADIAANTAAILADWEGDYGAAFLAPGAEGPYRTPEEALGALYGGMTTGLEFTVDARLGRPLGTFERPRPRRAEARRSGRSLAHVLISVQSNQQLAAILAADLDNAAEIDAAFDRAAQAALNLDDPDFSGVSDPSGRLRIETLQQRVTNARDAARLAIGPALGIAEGFNALDGD